MNGRFVLLKLVKTGRGTFHGVSTARIGTIFLVPMITICWILIFDPALFGR
jgi:hypothetical protein